MLIVPGDPETSVLYNKVADTGDFGGIMPAAGAPLSAQQIDTIRRWVEDGALDN